jgi:uncharacterized phage-associated protein
MSLDVHGKERLEMTILLANRVADEIISFCNAHGDFVSNLKLQKLLYYAQAWHLALHGKSLFCDPIEAWVHGPVVPAVYRRFKQFGWKPIQLKPKPSRLSPAAKSHVMDVMSAYGALSAFDLERLVHQEEPWRIARGDIAPDAPCRNIIGPDSMRSYYHSRLKKHG